MAPAIVEPARAALVANVFLVALDATEVARGAPARFRFREAGLEVPLHLHLKGEAELLVHLVLLTTPSEEGAYRRCEFMVPGHLIPLGRRTGARGSRRPMPVPNRRSPSRADAALHACSRSSARGGCSPSRAI